MKTALDAQICPNKSNHVSADPAYDRIKCPWCGEVYVQKPEITVIPGYCYNSRTDGYVKI